MYMKPEVTIVYEFVEYIPEEIKERTLYISCKYGTAVHKCFCGCGREVVTPLSPIGWRLTYDGKSVSLSPSIGSWNLPCKSHYLIMNNKVVWASQWNRRQIIRGRTAEAEAKKKYYKRTPASLVPNENPGVSSDICKTKSGLFSKIKIWVFNRLNIKEPSS
jgi:hypothetical protein